MAKLDSLIRFHKHELEEHQKQLSELNSLATKIEYYIEQIEQQMELEMEASTKDPLLASTLPNYLKKCKDKKAELKLSLNFVEEKIIETTAIIRDKFAELKKYELVDQKRKDEEALKKQKFENQELDEIGLDSHRRKHSNQED